MQSKPIILYDGHCALCSGFVQTVLRLDDRAVFQFAPLQSDIGAEILQKNGIDPKSLDSVVLWDKNECYLKSNAFFEIVNGLGWPYKALYLFKFLPLSFRNMVYDWVARNRYAVFGTNTSCWMPQKEWKGRFLGEA